ncbi:MAG: hypothetical protein WBY44_21710 [Bryobacteraceae bacterium]
MRQLRNLGKLTVDDLLPLRATLVAALGNGTAEIETPQLGRVVFRTPMEIQSAIAWLDNQIALVSSTAQTFVFQSNRGTGL